MSTSLTPDQESQLLQFKEFTSYNEAEEHEKVMRLLTVCDWNLESAVARYFDNDFPTLFDEQAPHSPGSDTATSQTSIPGAGFNIPDRFSTPFPAPREQVSHQAIAIDNRFLDMIPKLPKAIPIQNKWKFQVGLATPQQSAKKKTGLLAIPSVVFILMLFPKLCWFVGYGLSKILGPIFPTLFRILGFREGPHDFPAKPLYLTSEEVNTHNIKSYIEEVLGESSDLPIYEQGEFNDAFNLAKSELRWMVCILVNSQTDLSKKFIKSYLNNDLFIKLIKENNVILYVGDVCYPEAFEVGNTYKAFSLPYINLIANVSSTGATLPLMSIVTRFQNFETVIDNRESSKKLVKRLQKIIDKYEPQLITQRIDLQETQFSRLIRQEQDDAYQESLLRDKSKLEEKKQKELVEKQKQEELKRLEELAKLKERQRISFLKEHSSRIRSDENWLKDEYTTIQLRNHQGERIIKKFFNDETLYDIFLCFECQLFLKEEMKKHGMTKSEVISMLNEEDKSDNVDITGYKHEFKFDLVSPMPRLKLTPDKNKLLIDVKELWPNGSLLMEHHRNDVSSDEYESSDDDEEREN